MGEIPVNCQNSSICHTITTSSQVTKSIGYVPVGVQNEYKTNLVSYVGSMCDDKLNYTIDIRYICGNNLGYPTYPPTSITNACKTILHWETAAACKGAAATSKADLSTFGINESPCYTVDKVGGNRYDLSPLIRLNGSYKVWSAENGTEFFINVCSDATDRCRPGSSACFRNSLGQMESIGSYKWSSIEFRKASEAAKHDYVQLTYKAKNALCNSPISTTLNESTTNIRFICPRQTTSLHRYPVLVSSLDCRYEIEWVTDYACPQEELSFPENNCLIDDTDLSPLQRSAQPYEFKDVKRLDGSTVNISLNVCGGALPADKCKLGSAVCVMNATSRTSFARKKATFVKADNRLSLNYVSGGASCQSKDGFKMERVVVEFECDPTATTTNATSQPELIEVQECSYLLKWRTALVCPLIMPSLLNCTYVNEQAGFQVDLSSLMRPDGFYEVQRFGHDPRLKYLIANSSRILLNVCSKLPLQQTATTASNFSKECAGAAACLLDAGKKEATSLGHFREPIQYDQALGVLTLRYTGGSQDPVTKKPLSTVINFHCAPWSKNNEPYLIDYDQATGQYTVEYNTPAACRLFTARGTDCQVTDPATGFQYDLRPLASRSFYSIKTDRYDFELNVCQPVVGGSCAGDTDHAICQKEHSGGGRAFSLGRATTALSYWNTMLNMTFIGGTPYNDEQRTPRRSHISFICDEKAANGFPEFDGERDRAYFFRWYTALACPQAPPKVTHCVFENETHFFDLSPLSLDRGNHFALNGQSLTIAYINFCRPLNPIRDNLLNQCKPNTGICLVDFLKSEVSLGEPLSHPFLGFDGTIYMLYNNGDPCPANRSQPLSSSIQLICSPDLEEDLTIDFFDPVKGEECTYNFVVRSPVACPRAFHDTVLQDCVYTDRRTNLSADLGALTKPLGDYAVSGGNPQTTYSLNMCKAVSQPPSPPAHGECSGAAVCLRTANNSILNYGRADSMKLYLEGGNLHLRYTNGSRCDDQVDGRMRATDIEFICDETKPTDSLNAPSLYYQNHCLAKFQWRTAAVCNLVIPSCSLVDDTNGNYYSLRPLASMSHAWNVSATSGADEYYLLNVCKALPLHHNCSSSAGACKCRVVDRATGEVDCSANLGKVSDHELALDPLTHNLVLTYEGGDRLCNGSVARTQIRFRCSATESGHGGPRLISTEDCTFHFVWDSIFACAMQNITANSVHLSMGGPGEEGDSRYVVHDTARRLQWNLAPLFTVAVNVTEKTRQGQNGSFTYAVDLGRHSHEHHPQTGNCVEAAICQVKHADGFTRDIGSFGNMSFSFVGADLYLVLTSANSKCGRKPSKNVSSKIRFICNYAAGLGSPHFVFESEECDYFFTWETDAVCQLVENRPMPSPNDGGSSTKHSGLSTGWVVGLLFLFALCGFAGWLFVSSGTKRDDVVYHIRRLFRRNETPQIPFRYQQLSI